MTEPLHTDDPTATFTMPDGRVIKNLTPVDYDITYDDPDLTLHTPPPIPDGLPDA